MRFRYFLLLLCTGTTSLLAQNKGPLLRFIQDVYDFGPVSERSGDLKHRFSFVNDGSGPLWLNSVQPSCACTTPEWSHDSIFPGDTGYVDVSYSTYARPGDFSKTIGIYPNTPQGVIIITIKGEVYLPNDDSEAANQRMYFGDLRFAEGYISADPIFNNQVDTFTARLVNSGAQTVNILEVSKLPKYIRLQNVPESVEPGETALMKVIVDGSKIGKWGYVSDQIVLLSDDPIIAPKGLSVVANVKEYFPKMTKSQLKKQPLAEVDRYEHSFGSHQEGAILHTSFSVVNSGKTPLIIHDVVTDCACVAVDWTSKTLAPGERAELKVSFDTVLRQKTQVRPIKIVSNDPRRPELMMYLKATLIP